MTDIEKLKRQVIDELQDGPLLHEELSERIHGCECSNKVTQLEHDKVCKAVRQLHRDNKATYTVDRRVEIND
jgi:hypothetical protein